jgi:hypothetical protein
MVMNGDFSPLQGKTDKGRRPEISWAKEKQDEAGAINVDDVEQEQGSDGT